MSNERHKFRGASSFLHVILTGIWILLPSGPFLIARLIKEADFGLIILMAMLLPSLTAIVETLVISSYKKKKSDRELFAIVPLGWLAQYLVLVIIFSAYGPDLGILLFALWSILPYIIAQAATVVCIPFLTGLERPGYLNFLPIGG